MFPESAVLFKDIAFNHPEHKTAVYAANLYLDSLNALGGLVEHPNPSCYNDLTTAVDAFISTDESPGKDLMKDEEFASAIKQLKIDMQRKLEEVTQE